jgi:caffeoyl-CoA O-methyltransferase
MHRTSLRINAPSTSLHAERRLGASVLTLDLLLGALTIGAISACQDQRSAASASASASAPAAPASREAAAPSSDNRAVSPAIAPEAAQVPPPIKTVLDDIKRRDSGQLSVSPEDGQFLRMFVAATGRKRALEIGAASGYSAIWIGLGLKDTGGRLVTIEYDPVRAKEAADNIRRAGLTDVVEVIAGDAFEQIPRLPGTFDCIFVDAWKRDYIKFFEMTYPRLDRGGIFLGHNVINKKSEMGDFLARITTHPDLFTSIVAPAGEGISVSYKRR